MKPTAAPSSNATNLAALRTVAHPRCVVCSPAHPLGLQLEFAVQPDGSVEGHFGASELFEGYPGRLHGGVTAALLDGAMTHCLFAHGCRAVTAELTVRYREPVATGRSLTVRAWLMERHGPLWMVGAEIQQAGHRPATAWAKFMPAI